MPGLTVGGIWRVWSWCSFQGSILASEWSVGVTKSTCGLIGAGRLYSEQATCGCPEISRSYTWYLAEVRSAKALYGSTSVDLPGHKQTLRLSHCGIEFNPSKPAESLMRLLLTPSSLSQLRTVAIVSMPDNCECQRHLISSQQFKGDEWGVDSGVREWGITTFSILTAYLVVLEVRKKDATCLGLNPPATSWAVQCLP